MSYMEKSAGLSLFALFIATGFYMRKTLSASLEQGLIAAPETSTLIIYVALVTIISVVGNIVVSAMASQDAAAGADERDKSIARNASAQAGQFLAVGAVFSLIVYIQTNNGDALFHGVFISLMLSQITQNVLQLVYYRRAF